MHQNHMQEFRKYLLIPINWWVNWHRLGNLSEDRGKCHKRASCPFSKDNDKDKDKTESATRVTWGRVSRPFQRVWIMLTDSVAKFCQIILNTDFIMGLVLVALYFYVKMDHLWIHMAINSIASTYLQVHLWIGQKCEARAASSPAHPTSKRTNPVGSQRPRDLHHTQ